MKIFISSLIGGFESFRSAARSAITALRHEAVMAEDFGALPTTPQVACLQGLRSADMVVLILGERYGVVQGTSGVSPTHEEYNEARGRQPILTFVQEEVARQPEQEKFIKEVEGWQQGNYRAGFKTADQLRDLVTRAIHDYELATAAGPVDAQALIEAATDLLPATRNNNYVGSPLLNVALVGGPLQRILRPAELEATSLVDDLQQQALFGARRIFDRSKGTETGIDGAVLYFSQEGGARIQLDERGALLLQLPLKRSGGRDRHDFGGMLAIIEEDVVRELTNAIAYADWTLERIDPTQRITRIALAVSIEVSDHMGWRTQAEQDASPNSGTMRMGQSEHPPVHVDEPRAALRFKAHELAEDLMVPLRRQRKSGY